MYGLCFVLFCVCMGFVMSGCVEVCVLLCLDVCKYGCMYVWIL